MIGDHFTKSKAMVFPRQVLAGHGVLRSLPSVVEELGYEGRVLLVTGGHTSSIAGKRVRTMLEKIGLEVRMEITGSANMENLNHLYAVAASWEPEAVFGVGGGSKIDLGKMAARRGHSGFVSIPTSASHDGIASPRVSIKDGTSPLSMEGVMPAAIIADTQLISKAPYRMLASGCADVISNSTALTDWELAVKAGKESFSTTAASLSRYAADSVMASASRISRNDETSTWLAVRPIIASGLAMGAAGSSRPASGSEHLFSHALDAMSAGYALHGEQCGVGAILMTALHGGDWEIIRTSLIRLKCPVTAEGLGVNESDIIRALVKARTMRRDRYTILDVKRLTKESARKLARKTLVI